jgi:hypothetical protein
MTTAPARASVRANGSKSTEVAASEWISECDSTCCVAKLASIRLRSGPVGANLAALLCRLFPAVPVMQSSQTRQRNYSCGCTTPPCSTCLVWHVLLADLVRQILLNRQRGKTTAMQPDHDSRKRPLLTAEQLRKMSRVSDKPKKGSPREEFENLLPTDRRATDVASCH